MSKCIVEVKPKDGEYRKVEFSSMNDAKQFIYDYLEKGDSKEIELDEKFPFKMEILRSDGRVSCTVSSHWEE